MSKRIVTADWAAQVPAEGVIGLQDYINRLAGIRINLSQINQSGALVNQSVKWNGSAWVPYTPSSGGSSGTTIQSGDTPAFAARKRPAGVPLGQYQDIWYRHEFNVGLYGATGNGFSTSDVQAVAQAITALNGAGGGSLVFPAGTYIGMEGIPAITAPCMVLGAGQGVTVLSMGTTGGLQFTDDGSGMAFGVSALSIEDAYNGITISGGTGLIDNVTISAFRSGVILDGASRGHVSHCQILSAGGTGNGIELIGDAAGNEVDDLYIAGFDQFAVSCGTATADNRIANIAFIDTLGATAIQDQGTNNFADGLFGLGGNTDQRWETRKELVAWHEWQPCPMAQGAGASEDVFVPGARIGDQVIVGRPYPMPEVLVDGFVRDNDTARILVFNLGTAISPASGTWKVRVLS